MTSEQELIVIIADIVAYPETDDFDGLRDKLTDHLNNYFRAVRNEE